MTTEKVYEFYDYVFNAHKKGFQKAFHQAEFLYEEVWITGYRLDVNKDIYEGQMLVSSKSLP